LKRCFCCQNRSISSVEHIYCGAAVGEHLNDSGSGGEVGGGSGSDEASVAEDREIGLSGASLGRPLVLRVTDMEVSACWSARDEEKLAGGTGGGETGPRSNWFREGRSEELTTLPLTLQIHSRLGPGREDRQHGH
jgi:hypothetical protein